MIVVARDVTFCRFHTQAPAPPTRLELRSGDEHDLVRLDPEHHSPRHVVELRRRLERGEHWTVCIANNRVIAYCWLHLRPQIDYPYLPGCYFLVGRDAGSGYDAWTHPRLRNRGLRRATFLADLAWLRSIGRDWEVGVFVQHQLDGALRSLRSAGIVVEPLWRVRLDVGRTLVHQRLSAAPTLELPCLQLAAAP